MSVSTRFPVALHILISLTLRRGEWLSSDSLAWSVNTNPSMVRRIVSSLIQAGLVTSRVGIAGGSQLAVKPDRITLLDAYRAVKLKQRVGIHSPNPECPLGAILSEPLQAVLDETEDAVAAVLARTTIANISEVALERITGRSKPSS